MTARSTRPPDRPRSRRPTHATQDHIRALGVFSEVDPQLKDDGSGLGAQPRARFQVTEWFAGGSESTVLVWLQREVSVGDRLLVSGQPRWDGEPLEDAIQWECGWTIAYSSADASAWRGATAA